MRSIAERIGEPFRKRNVGYGSSKTVQHDVAKIVKREEIPKYLSTENALAYLKKTGFPMSKSKLYKLTSYGRIPFHKSGNTLLFIPEELDKWCESDIYADDEKHLNKLIINKTPKMSHKNK